MTSAPQPAPPALLDDEAVLTGDAKARLAAIAEREAAATGTAWHWAGNTDHCEPYLATWLPGYGRCQILDIGHDERSKTGPAADEVRATAAEYDLDPEEMVENWALDRNDEPILEPRLRFYDDGQMVHARDRVVFEVAPEALARSDRRVYRADIVGVRHPDARFIEHSRADMKFLLALAREQEATIGALLERVHATERTDARNPAPPQTAARPLAPALREGAPVHEDQMENAHG